MAVIKKNKNNHSYYYLAGSGRVDGKPGIVSQKYPGRAGDIIRAVEGQRNMHRAGGAVVIPPLPWPYARLDPEVVRKSGHGLCHEGHNCGYGSAAALLFALREKVGFPFTVIPPEMFRYGGGGGAGEGTLCGALNGAGAVINLVCSEEQCFQVFRDLLRWYAQTPLPTGKHAAYSRLKEHRVSVAGAPLCSMSLFNWGMASLEKLHGEAQEDRCAKLVGDTAARAAELLNKTLL